jgi:hypothetical protein
MLTPSAAPRGREGGSLLNTFITISFLLWSAVLESQNENLKQDMYMDIKHRKSVQ